MLNDQQVADALRKPRADYWPTARPAWKEGTTVTDRVTKQAETYQMVVYEDTCREIEKAFARGDTSTAAKNLGGWATKDPIQTQADVRGNLAISSEWKVQNGQPMYVIEFTVKPGVGVREGTVGPMFDKNAGIELAGGGH